MYFVRFLLVQLLSASSDSTNIREDSPTKNKEVCRCPNCNCEMTRESPQTSYVDLAEDNDNASEDMVEKNIPSFSDDYRLSNDAITNAFVGIITNKFASKEFDNVIYRACLPFGNDIDKYFELMKETYYDDGITLELKETKFKGLDDLKSDICNLTIKDIVSAGKEACLVKTQCQTSVKARDSIFSNTEIYTDEGNFDVERLSDTAVIHTAIISKSHKSIYTIVYQAVKNIVHSNVYDHAEVLINEYSKFITKKLIERIEMLTQGCLAAKIKECKSITVHDAASIVKEACNAQKNTDHVEMTFIDNALQSETENHMMSDDEGSSISSTVEKIKKFN